MFVQASLGTTVSESTSLTRRSTRLPVVTRVVPLLVGVIRHAVPNLE